MSGTNPTCNLLLRIYNVRNCNGNEIIPGIIQNFCNPFKPECPEKK